MANVDEVIDFIKSLKKGFDKDLFQSKIDELAHAVDTSGLEYEDFHTLFKVWLNLSIPITKWVSLGICLVPHDRVEERTVDYAFRWLLANCENHLNFSRMAFVLDWLTAAMDTGCIDIVALDAGYEIFCNMLMYEVLTAHTIKLIYTLTKPSDVTRKRVLELLEYAKKIEDKKSVNHKIQVLLGLFKSYRPECVPENVPAISIHTSFKKLNFALIERFRRSQNRNNSNSKKRQHLLWINPLHTDGSKNKKADPLVPHMEFCNVGSKQYAEKETKKNYLDFSDPVSLLHYSLQHPMSRPARLRALLCNDTGLTLLVLASDAEQAFLSHDLYHLLSSCFLDASPHSYAEKQGLLRRLGAFQRSLLQGMPVVTRFLAQFLPLWNERDYFGEILELVEWIDVEYVDHVTYILDPLMRIYHRAQPMEQCAILKSLTAMYTNLVYASTRNRHHFMSARPPAQDYSQMLPLIASCITDMCDKGLQFSPDDMRVLYSSVLSAETMSRAEARCGVSLGALPRPLTLTLPLISTSAILLDKMAALLILYKKIFSAMKSTNKLRKDQTYVEQRKILEGYTADVISCLYHEQALDGRKSGFVFNKLHPQLVAKLGDLVPEADTKYSLRNNLAFAAYTYGPLQAVHPSDANNKFCFDAIISHTFPNLSGFLMRTVPELR